AGSGVGKSVALGMLARNCKADVIVISLVGERGREVREFCEDVLGEEAMQRAVVVAAPADSSPLARAKGAWYGTEIASWFRDQGMHVVLIVDSLTRFAMALREIGLSLGEAPVSRGYTPSVFGKIPELIEKAGNGINDFPFSAQTRDQSGFTAPHRSIKTDDIAFDSFLQKVNRLIDLIQMILKTHASKLRLSGMHYNKRYDHFFHRYTTVLKSISKMIGIVIEVVLINKILLFDGEDETTVKMGGWQLNDFWVINFND
ncbi:MAG: hypothetical protein EBY38_09185, partial [Flavobacteriaceae bacterium]|nr:hypothetical protein [Flavobacteriaceae bacterium]